MYGNVAIAVAVVMPIGAAIAAVAISLLASSSFDRLQMKLATISRSSTGITKACCSALQPCVIYMGHTTTVKLSIWLNLLATFNT